MRSLFSSARSITAALFALMTLFSMPNAQADDRAGVEFTQCTEFVGVTPVSETAARAMVPQRYQLVADAAGARLLVRVTDCEGIRVGSLPRRPGRIAQTGIVIVSPDGTATDPNTAINNYMLSYATNLPALVERLRRADVPAVLDLNLAYEFAPPQGPSELYAATTPAFGSAPTWFIHGTVTQPGIQTTFLANWWFAQGNSETKMATTFPVIFFDFTSAVALYTSRNNRLGQLIGGNQIERFPLSFRGAYGNARMAITETP
jgi:hypothetical protein